MSKDLYKMFKAALDLRGITVSEFANRIGVTPRFLLYVLRGERQSERVRKEVEKFVEEVFKVEHDIQIY